MVLAARTALNREPDSTHFIKNTSVRKMMSPSAIDFI